MLAYASQNMTHDLLLQESNKLEGLSLQQPERRDTHGKEDSMILQIKTFVLQNKSTMLYLIRQENKSSHRFCQVSANLPVRSI
jgi:hypothetical protein